MLWRLLELLRLLLLDSLLKSWIFLELLHDVDEFLLGVYSSLNLSLIQLSKFTDNFIQSINGDVVLNNPISYLCDLFGVVSQLMVMIILREYQFSVLQHFLRIDLVVGVKLALVGEIGHCFEYLSQFTLDLSLLPRVLALIEDGFDETDVVLIEIKCKERVRGCKVVARRLEGLVLSDDVHLV